MPAHKITTAERRKRIIRASREMKGLTQAHMDIEPYEKVFKCEEV